MCIIIAGQNGRGIQSSNRKLKLQCVGQCLHGNISHQSGHKHILLKLVNHAFADLTRRPLLQVA